MAYSSVDGRATDWLKLVQIYVEDFELKIFPVPLQLVGMTSTG